MRTRSALAVGFSVVAVVAAGVVVGTNASAAGDHTLRIHEKFAKTATVDLGDKGPSIGDHLSYVTDITKPGGGKIGIGIGDCTRLTGSSDSDGVFQCTETAHLDGGDILCGGLYDLTAKVNKWTVMGGTERYRGVTGQVDFTAVDANNFDDVFHLGS